jgi:hypothetical protein
MARGPCPRARRRRWCRRSWRCCPWGRAKEARDTDHLFRFKSVPV